MPDGNKIENVDDMFGHGRVDEIAKSTNTVDAYGNPDLGLEDDDIVLDALDGDVEPLGFDDFAAIVEDDDFLSSNDETETMQKTSDEQPKQNKRTKRSRQFAERHKNNENKEQQQSVLGYSAHQKTTKSNSTEEFDDVDVPEWVVALRSKLYASVSHAFLLHGNIRDYMVRNITIRDGIVFVLDPDYATSESYFEVIALYDQAHGLSFYGEGIQYEDGRELSEVYKERFIEQMHHSQERLSLQKTEGIPNRDPVMLFTILSDIFEQYSETHRAKLLLFIDYADFLVPDASSAQMKPDERKLAITLSDIGRSSNADDAGNCMIFVTDDMTQLSTRIRSSESRIEQIKVPLPDLDERSDFIETVLDIPDNCLSDKTQLFEHPDTIDKHMFAVNSAGLSRMQIEDIMLRALSEDVPLSLQLMKERKNDIIKEDYDDVLEIIDSNFGFAQVGGMDYIKEFFKEEVIDPIQAGDREAVPMGVLLAGPPGSSKPVASDTKVHCLNEFGVHSLKNIADLTTSDRVFSRWGIPIPVLDIIDRGKLDAYKLVLEDGRNIVCSIDHVWGVYDLSENGAAPDPRNLDALGELGSDGNSVFPTIKELTIEELLEAGLEAAENKKRFLVPAGGTALYDEAQGIELHEAEELGNNIGLFVASLSKNETHDIDDDTQNSENDDHSFSIINEDNYMMLQELSVGSIPQRTSVLRGFGNAFTQAKETGVVDVHLSADIAIDDKNKMLNDDADSDNKISIKNFLELIVETYYSLGFYCVIDENGFTVHVDKDNVGNRRYVDGNTAAIAIKEIIPLNIEINMTCITVDALDGLFMLGNNYVVAHNTMISKALAREAGMNFVALNLNRIMEKWVGSTERNLDRALECAMAMAPTIIFIDEIDEALPNRADPNQSAVNKRINQRLLTFFSETEHRGQVMILAATNYPEKIDPAFKRAGRFDMRIPMFSPDEFDRMRIMNVIAKTRGYTFSWFESPDQLIDNPFTRLESWLGEGNVPVNEKNFVGDKDIYAYYTDDYDGTPIKHEVYLPKKLISVIGASEITLQQFYETVRILFEDMPERVADASTGEIISDQEYQKQIKEYLDSRTDILGSRDKNIEEVFSRIWKWETKYKVFSMQTFQMTGAELDVVMNKAIVLWKRWKRNGTNAQQTLQALINSGALLDEKDIPWEPFLYEACKKTVSAVPGIKRMEDMALLNTSDIDFIPDALYGVSSENRQVSYYERHEELLSQQTKATV